jgi:predicted PurR-regulated permease PerM
MVLRLALYTVLIIGVVYSLMRLRAIITAIIVAAILAYIIRPIAGKLLDYPWFVHPHDWLAGIMRRIALTSMRLMGRSVQSRSEAVRLTLHARRTIATVYVVLLLFVLGYYGVKVLVDPFVAEAKKLTANYSQLHAQWQNKATDVRIWYEKNVPAGTRAWLERQLSEAKNGDSLDIGARATAWGQEALKRIMGMMKNLVEVVLLPVLAFYFALDSKKLKHEFVGLLPRRRAREVLRMIHVFNQIMYSYVVGQAILCIIAGVVVGIGLAALRMDYAVTLGVLAGVTRAIPIIGPILGGIPIVLLALITKGFGVALGVLIFFSILHFVESKFIMPLLIGDRMELHAVVIIVVLLVGGEFAGLLGMFFAPPIAAIVRVVARRYWLRRSTAGEPLSLKPLPPAPIA